MRTKWFITVIISFLPLVLRGYVTYVQGSSSECAEQTSCGACLQVAPHCAWCTQLNFDDGGAKRCDTEEELKLNGCNRTNIVSPQGKIAYIKNENPRNKEGDRPAIQLAPQVVNLDLRPNEPFKFEVSFRQAENFPVDLYYIMDLSNSMSDDKDKVAELGDKLAEEMSKITNDFHLGFGSFVDKNTAPYAALPPTPMSKPCAGCVLTYGFRNQLPLTDDTSQFKYKVSSTKTARNLDGPEAGLDAIMQAIACHLAGIVTPNDGACHLDNEGLYTESLNQDYPSIGQLAHSIAAKKVNVIFAVTKEVVPIYEGLGDVFQGSTVGELAGDSSNVVGLVRDNYDKISSTVELKTEGQGNVLVNIRANCDREGFQNKHICEKLGIGENVTFEVTVEVKSCPKDLSKWNQTFSIYPVGLNERLTVNLNLICQCDCEMPQFEESNSTMCSGAGTYECGACTCGQGTYGKECQCSAGDLESLGDDAAPCIRSNSSEVCEGRGQCVCGQCECYPITPDDPSRKYVGPFCECNNYVCDHFDGEPCGGASRGVCKCGKCECQPGFTGEACDCTTDSSSCIAKESGLMCNGKGTCECGVCNCHLDKYYGGPTCEDCPVCPGKCEENKACVQCKAFESGELTSVSCDANCSHVKVVENVKNQPNYKVCKFRDSDNCDFYFSYGYFSEIVEVQRTKECPKQVNMWVIVGGVIGGIILIGLALLIIGKVMVTIYDRREFAKFEKEQKKARWREEDNPIYQGASSTFKNPSYTK